MIINNANFENFEFSPNDIYIFAFGYEHRSYLTAKANDQFEENGASKLLSGSVRVDGYNRHLDILYDAKILVSR